MKLEAIDYIDALPLTDKAIQRSITQARDTYRRTVEQEEWELKWRRWNWSRVTLFKEVERET